MSIYIDTATGVSTGSPSPGSTHYKLLVPPTVHRPNDTLYDR